MSWHKPLVFHNCNGIIKVDIFYAHKNSLEDHSWQMLQKTDRKNLSLVNIFFYLTFFCQKMFNNWAAIVWYVVQETKICCGLTNLNNKISVSNRPLVSLPSPHLHSRTHQKVLFIPTRRYCTLDGPTSNSLALFKILFLFISDISNLQKNLNPIVNL